MSLSVAPRLKAMRRGPTTVWFCIAGSDMSFWDFFANAATGGAYGALGTGIDVITQTKVSSDSATPKPLDSGHGGLFGGFAGGMLGQPAGPRATTCCDRYTFSDGFP